MSEVRLRRMVQAYGAPIKFKYRPFLNRQSRVLKDKSNAVTIEFNPRYGIPNSKDKMPAMKHLSELIKARRVGLLIAEKEGYPLMRYCGFTVMPSFISALNESEDASAVRMLENALMPKVMGSVERSMVFLQHIVANNIMEADFGYDVGRDYYYTDRPHLTISFAHKLSILMQEEEKYRDFAGSQFVFRMSMSSSLIYLAENFIYQDEETRHSILKCMDGLVKETFFGFLKATNVGLPKDVLASQDFRKTYFSRDRYMGAIEETKKFFGTGQLLELDVADQKTFDNRIGIEALQILDKNAAEPDCDSLSHLLYALDLFVRIQTLDVEKQLDETFRLCFSIEKSLDRHASNEFILARLIVRARELNTKWAEYFLIESVKKLGPRGNGRF